MTTLEDLRNHTVTKVNHLLDYCIIIYMTCNYPIDLPKDLLNIVNDYATSRIVLYAEADCCSESWFEILNNLSLQTIVGKEIIAINDIDDRQIDLPESGRQEYDKNTAIRITFSDSHYEFALRNSSNGYYNGWLDISIDPLTLPIHWNVNDPDYTDNTWEKEYLDQPLRTVSKSESESDEDE